MRVMGSDESRCRGILKVLYDEDVLEEEIILKWGADPKSAARFGVELETSQLVRKQVKPFLEWLATADDDSDSESWRPRRVDADVITHFNATRVASRTMVRSFGITRDKANVRGHDVQNGAIVLPTNFAFDLAVQVVSLVTMIRMYLQN